jgi:Protein of unknown function (DUF3040)
MLDDGDLSDSERRRLAEIESSLSADDPRFVGRFAERRLRRRHKGRNAVAVLAIGVAAAVVGVALARDSVLFAVLGLVAIGATAGIWVTVRRGG